MGMRPVQANWHGIRMAARTAILSVSLLGGIGTAVASVQKSEIVPTWSGAEVGEWTFDYVAATNNAAHDKTGTLLLFSGMWWCPHCQALEADVLTDGAWQSYVQKRGLYESVLDYPARNGKSNWCWLWETNYVESAGLTLEAAAAEQVRRYSVQDAFATPDASRQSVTLDGCATFTYGKIGYPTLLVLRDDGSVAGRFSVSRTNANLGYVTNRIEQAFGADAWDEPDDFWQTATTLESPSCEDEAIVHGDHTLSIVDTADWYCIDVSSGVGGQWIFSFGEHPDAPKEDLLVGLYESPTNSPVASQVITPGVGGDFAAIMAKGGIRWLKVSPAHGLQKVIGYSLSYQYALAPATISFGATNVTVRSTDKAVSLSVKIADASRDAEVVLDWVAEDGDALCGVDYEVANGTLTWPVGSVKRTKAIAIPIIRQTAWKGDRSFTVRLYPRRHCVVSSAVAECLVKIRECAARKPGTLSFDAAVAKRAQVVREGETVALDVSRTQGCDGVVTGIVSLVVGRQVEVLTNLVWRHHDDVLQKVVYALPSLEAFREDTAATLRLTAQGGARVASGSAKLTFRDALVDETFSDYRKRAFANALSVSGMAWFYGRTENGSDEPVLRSRPLNGKKSELSYRVRGPAIVEVDSQKLNGAAAELSLGKKCLTNGSPVRVAIPAGMQTLKLSATGADEAFVTATFRTVSLADYRLMADFPRTGQAVVCDSALSLVGRTANAVLPIEPGIRVETLFGMSAAGMKVIGTNDLAVADAGIATFPQTAVQRKDLEAAALPNMNRNASWRMDAVFVDSFGNRAVQQGMVSSVSLRTKGCPSFAWSLFGGAGDWAVDSERAEAILTNLTVGVEANCGPIPLDGIGTDGVVSVAVKNGRLPTGVKAVVDENGIWLRGVPNKAGEFTCELLLSAKTLQAGKRVTVNGVSCRLTAIVRELGDVVASYDGYAVREQSPESVTPGLGMASFTVSKTGAISGKFVLDGTNVAFKGSAWTARTNETFYLSTLVKIGKGTVPLSLVTDDPDLGVDARIVVGERFYWLNRNRWTTESGKALVAPLAGQYVAALPRAVGTDPSPSGTGYLCLTVKTNGSVIYSGRDSLGKTFSGKSVLYYATDCCNVSGYHWGFYLFAQPGGEKSSESGLYGLVEIIPSETGNMLSALGASRVRNVNVNPASIAENCAWTNELEVIGGRMPVNGLAPSGEWMQTDGLSLPADFDGRMGTSGCLLVTSPSDLVIRSTPKGGVSFSPNEWNAQRVSYAAKTGIASFGLTVAYEGENANGKVVSRRRTLKAQGVYVPVSTLGVPFWAGFVTVPEIAWRADGGSLRQVTVQTPCSWCFEPVETHP